MSNIKVITERSNIIAIADAVRNKTRTSNEMTLGEIVTGINNIYGTEDLLVRINEKTGVEDTTLSNAINRLIEGYVYSIETSENVNHVLKAFIAASSVENNNMNFESSKAGDGDYNTRWASKYPSTYGEGFGFDTNP